MLGNEALHFVGRNWVVGQEFVRDFNFGRKYREAGLFIKNHRRDKRRLLATPKTQSSEPPRFDSRGASSVFDSNYYGRFLPNLNVGFKSHPSNRNNWPLLQPQRIPTLPNTLLRSECRPLSVTQSLLLLVYERFGLSNTFPLLANGVPHTVSLILHDIQLPLDRRGLLLHGFQLRFCCLSLLSHHPVLENSNSGIKQSPKGHQETSPYHQLVWQGCLFPPLQQWHFVSHIIAAIILLAAAFLSCFYMILNLIFAPRWFLVKATVLMLVAFASILLFLSLL